MISEFCEKGQMSFIKILLKQLKWNKKICKSKQEFYRFPGATDERCFEVTFYRNHMEIEN